MIQRVVRPSRLRGEVTVPGDKSITHRAFLFNAMASGLARVRHYGLGDACFSTMGCLRGLGVRIEESGADEITVHGGGMRGFRGPKVHLDSGNSGTSFRLMTGLLASLPFESTITGDASLRRRPMDRVMQSLRLMGAEVSGSGPKGSLAPLRIRGGDLHGVTYRMPVASAQVKSAVLIAGLSAEGETVVEEPAPTRDHTERMLRAMGARLTAVDGRIAVRAGPLQPVDVDVPGDISSAAFWLVAGCLHPDAEVVVRGVGVNPGRTGVLEALRDMGADVSMENEREVGGEPVADLRARSSRVRAIHIGGAMVPRVIDELPVLAIAAAFAEGVTEIRDAQELRVKESDRVATTCGTLRALGATVEELKDGMIVHGGGRLRGAACSSHGDHRLAMCAAVAGLALDGETVIEGAEAADISYPEFWADLAQLSRET